MNDVALAAPELQAQAPVPSECPLDATVIALKTTDMTADVLLEEGLPGHKLKAEPVVDHGEASADETGGAGEAPTHILAGIRWHVG